MVSDNVLRGIGRVQTRGPQGADRRDGVEDRRLATYREEAGGDGAAMCHSPLLTATEVWNPCSLGTQVRGGVCPTPISRCASLLAGMYVGRMWPVASEA
jgi:hypothetical protein